MSQVNTPHKKLKTMLADTLLVKYLENLKYLEILLNGHNNLAECFSDIEIKLVRQEFTAKQKKIQPWPTGMAKIFKITNLPEKFSQSAIS